MREIAKNMSDRRRLLQALIGSTAAWSLARFAIAEGFAAAPSAALTIDRLSDSVVLIAGAGGNVLALSGPDGMLLVDCGSPEHSGELLRTLASLPGGKSIRTVFNT